MASATGLAMTGGLHGARCVILGCVGEGLCPSRGRGRTPPLRKRYKRCNGRATARVAPTDALQGVRCGGPMWASAPTECLPIGFRRGRRPRRPALPRARCSIAMTGGLHGVRCVILGCVGEGLCPSRGRGSTPPLRMDFGECPYTISPKRAQVLLSVIFMSRYWPRADLSPTRCTRRPPAVRPERGQRASSVSPSTRQRRVLPT